MNCGSKLVAHHWRLPQIRVPRECWEPGTQCVESDGCCWLLPSCMLLAYVTCMCSESPVGGPGLLDGSLPNQSIMLRGVMGLLQRAWLGSLPPHRLSLWVWVDTSLYPWLLSKSTPHLHCATTSSAWMTFIKGRNDQVLVKEANFGFWGNNLRRVKERSRKYQHWVAS